jgi:hypothetical protein
MMMLTEVYQLMMDALKGLPYDYRLSKMSYYWAILKKLFGVVMMTGVLFIITSLILFIIDELFGGDSFVILVKYVVLLYVVATIPTIIDTIRISVANAYRRYTGYVIIYLILLVTTGFLLHLAGAESLVSLIE